MLVEENVSKLTPLKYPKVTQKYLDLVTGDIADVQLHFHVHQSILSPAVYWLRYHADAWQPLQCSMFETLGAHYPLEWFDSPWQ